MLESWNAKMLKRSILKEVLYFKGKITSQWANPLQPKPQLHCHSLARSRSQPLYSGRASQARKSLPEDSVYAVRQGDHYELAHKRYLLSQKLHSPLPSARLPLPSAPLCIWPS